MSQEIKREKSSHPKGWRVTRSVDVVLSVIGRPCDPQETLAGLKFCSAAGVLSALIRKEQTARLDLQGQHRAGGKQRIGIAGGLAAAERTCDQVNVEPRRRPRGHERYSVVVRAHPTSQPTVTKTAGIKQSSQICSLACSGKAEPNSSAAAMRPVQMREDVIEAIFVSCSPGYTASASISTYTSRDSTRCRAFSPVARAS